VVGTTYTNSTGKPISVRARMTGTSTNGAPQITINGIALIGTGVNMTTYTSEIEAIVPVGGTYIIGASVGTATLVYVKELR
jgi:hypothetical protein